MKRERYLCATFPLPKTQLTHDGEEVLRRLLVGRRPRDLDLDGAADVSVVLDLLHREEEALLDVPLLVDLGRALEPDVRRPHLAVGVLGRPVGTRPITMISDSSHELFKSKIYACIVMVFLTPFSPKHCPYIWVCLTDGTASISSAIPLFDLSHNKSPVSRVTPSHLVREIEHLNSHSRVSNSTNSAIVA